jgi:hypothetical protein
MEDTAEEGFFGVDERAGVDYVAGLGMEIFEIDFWMCWRFFLQSL